MGPRVPLVSTNTAVAYLVWYKILNSWKSSHSLDSDVEMMFWLSKCWTRSLMEFINCVWISDSFMGLESMTQRLGFCENKQSLLFPAYLLQPNLTHNPNHPFFSLSEPSWAWKSRVFIILLVCSASAHLNSLWCCREVVVEGPVAIFIGKIFLINCEVLHVTITVEAPTPDHGPIGNLGYHNFDQVGIEFQLGWNH